MKKVKETKVDNSKLTVSEIIDVLLQNRGIKTKKQKDDFFLPKISEVTPEKVGINLNDLKKTIDRINKAIKNKELIVVYGDYDVDGICATAILWETLVAHGANAMPYIPHRIDEGYGLSETGISNLQSKMPDAKLIITVDNGIVAKEGVEFAKEKDIDVIITDHHQASNVLPDAYSIVHSVEVCGAAVAWLLSQEIKKHSSSFKNLTDNHLELAAIATVADMMPVLGPNRAIIKEGFKELNTTKRLGLLAIFNEAGIDLTKSIGSYEVGYIIGPRINAMGRLEYAMDSLRLLCTKDQKKAKILADKLGKTNRERQDITQETFLSAKLKIENSKLKIGKLIFLSDKDYQPGVIGLVAGKLVEEFYRPTIVVSEGDKYSKASARSVSGFNITDFMRTAGNLLVNIGGHPMAGGFTVETSILKVLKEKLETLGGQMIEDNHLKKEIKIDCKLPMSLLSLELAEKIEKMEPFGIGNSTPVFSSNVVIGDMRQVGQDGKHLSVSVKDSNSNHSIRGIAFGQGKKSKELAIGDKVQLIYCIDVNSWNGQIRIQLRVKQFEKIR